jgi:hypothetical protein
VLASGILNTVKGKEVNTMKKNKICSIFAIVFVFFWGFGIMMSDITDPITEDTSNTRTTTGIITSVQPIVDSEYSNVMMKTEDGNLWTFEAIVPIDAECEVIFDTQGTDDVKDDTIIQLTIKINFQDN